jgi:GNAT superfamily N-acetyltransferase
MTITVRPVEPRDKERWLDLFAQYITFYEETVSPGIVALTWQRLVTQSDNMMGFAALDASGAIAGIAAIVFHRSTWSATYYCYLEDLFVDPACRGAGVGRALIEAVYAEAERRGADRTYWATAGTNVTARRLYDDVGVLTPFVQYRR